MNIDVKEVAAELWDAAVEEIGECRHSEDGFVLYDRDHKRACGRLETIVASHLGGQAESLVLIQRVAELETLLKILAPNARPADAELIRLSLARSM